MATPAHVIVPPLPDTDQDSMSASITDSPRTPSRETSNNSQPKVASPTPPPDRVVQSKRRLSQSQLTTVISRFRETEEKDFEQILSDAHPELIERRNALYADAFQNGVTASSNDKDRLDVVRSLLHWLFNNIEPPDLYTKETDVSHYQDVAAIASDLYQERHPSEDVPVSLVIASWCHDIERFIPETKTRYLPEPIDHYRKQAIHSLSSQKVCEVVLRGSPVTEEEKESIFHLIRHHDYPAKEALVVLGQTLIEEVRVDLAEQLKMLMNADSLVFFTATIRPFVSFKSKKNSPAWIWRRVITNIKRLEPGLRPKACHSIMELPKEVKDSMGFDQEDVRGLCPHCTGAEMLEEEKK